MSLLVVGSVALDSIETPWGRVSGVLGGSATYAALAACLWTPTSLVAVVGSDFPKTYARLLSRRGIHGAGLAVSRGRTFRWKGWYDAELQAHTTHLDLGVFKSFNPTLTPVQRRVRHAFLGNIHPSLQWRVFSQLESARITACDSRDDWIKNNRSEFLRLLTRMDLVFLNDGEARLLTGVSDLVQATRALARMGPKVAVVKKGEHGALAASKDSFFSLPAYPVYKVVDPTGAGDAFAGSCLGYLATQRQINWGSLCRALQAASVVASVTIEDFGPARLARLSPTEVLRRCRVYRSLTRWVYMRTRV